MIVPQILRISVEQVVSPPVHQVRPIMKLTVNANAHKEKQNVEMFVVQQGKDVTRQQMYVNVKAEQHVVIFVVRQFKHVIQQQVQVFVAVLLEKIVKEIAVQKK